MLTSLVRCLPVVLVAACGGPAPAPATEVSMSFLRAGFYDAPFPSDDLRGSGGRVDLSRLPNPDKNQLVEGARALLVEARGFAQSGAIYFRTTAAIDPASLPDVAASVTDAASVFVVAVDPSAPDYRRRAALDSAFLDDGGPIGAPNLLALLPVQGLPLRPRALYAAVVTRQVRDVTGRPLAASKVVADLAAGTRPAGLSDEAFAHYKMALTALGDAAEIAGLAVFTTGDPTAGMAAVRDDLLARPLPVVPPATVGDIFPDYCVFNTTVEVPVYQAGTPPYTKSGGAWVFDKSGKPVVDHVETARLFFTIPRAPAPTTGWPLMVFIRTGGGGDRPLADRGQCATEHFTTAIVPGSGPARDLARVGFAGVQIDNPLGGPRNTTDGDEQFLTFNVFNPAALRDNVRQSAAELILLARVLADVKIDVAGSCPDTGPSPAAPVGFDGKHLALMGHSMGGWIAPLTLAFQPRYGATVLSGAGGSYIANVMDKTKPARVRPYIEILLGYQTIGRDVVAHDPALTILQWAAEPSDPQVYDAAVVRSPAVGEKPRQVLMIQGIVDHYILPSIANATSLALGLDAAGPAHDATNAELISLHQTPLATLLPLAGRRSLTLPASANVDAATTAVVVQHVGDGLEDGHEAMFQRGPPKHQYRCFLASWLKGAPVVPVDGDEDAPCP